uniref:Uncharacterized protein n=2 Tax=Parascaris univalens TaxID=6257 RepID=A0A915CEC4_PARUN
MDNTVGGIKFANLMRRLDGLRKLSEKGSLDFDASLESALSSIENTEYFRRCDIESGFCSPMTNSINAECTIRDNSVGEQMLTMAKAHEISDDARDNSNCRVAPCYVPNMPRRNRFRGGPNTVLFVVREFLLNFSFTGRCKQKLS